MNRLVIIGNGFDLAHGLPTSYKNFIDDFWSNIKDSKHNVLISFNMENYATFHGHKNFHELSNIILGLDKKIKKNGVELYIANINQIQVAYNREQIIIYNNDFFKVINQKALQNWVDVENEYYKLLKECLKENSNESIIEINKQFLEVKNLLEKYLIEKVEEDYVFSKEVVKDFTDIFIANSYEGKDLDRLFLEFSKKDENFFKKEFQQEQMERYKKYLNTGTTHKDKIIFKNHFLSFNYTSTVFEYVKLLNLPLLNLNEIHGRLEDKRNPINFGFGDEMDKQYQEIEEKDDNEYLRNIKSFQYLHTSSYKYLLDLIDSEKFQVYIMGHSCGLSDRTLLNTIFEHENCCSIKVFYHEIKDENDIVIRDNYTEITQNISRHFNKKKLMREKIVNKTLCQPLPQVKLPKK